ncbi:hypothetical protein S101258_00123 [Lactiplantibacillus plantarum subsp. plantarum]|uniref:Uncharacterized protein n=1 Tax=Lactiplantibacillus plantarum subsp. plantarum TaxID=337330 RepID=A0A2S3UA42_LACPN|nr:hypothetical protein S101258_00123 [Lactiplantibacillus plantarum subsp. plantarum]
MDEARQVLSFVLNPDEVDAEVKRFKQHAQTEASNLEKTLLVNFINGKYRYLVIAGAVWLPSSNSKVRTRSSITFH